MSVLHDLLSSSHAMVGLVDVEWTQALSGLQGTVGAESGTVGEVGVHHGGYFAVLAQLARPGEALWACDLFDALQDRNLDRSGRGNLSAFRDTLRTFAAQRAESVQIVQRPSYELLEQNVAPPKPFRMLSIDGSHTAINAFTDLIWAERHLAEGGLIALDDVGSARWLGPLRALRSYWHMHSRDYTRLTPLLLAPRKLWLVARKWRGTYMDAIATVEGTGALGATTQPRRLPFREFERCMNANEPMHNGTSDAAPQRLPTPPPELAHVYAARVKCKIP